MYMFLTATRSVFGTTEDKWYGLRVLTVVFGVAVASIDVTCVLWMVSQSSSVRKLQGIITTHILVFVLAFYILRPFPIAAILSIIRGIAIFQMFRVRDQCFFTFQNKNFLDTFIQKYIFLDNENK